MIWLRIITAGIVHEVFNVNILGPSFSRTVIIMRTSLARRYLDVNEISSIPMHINRLKSLIKLYVFIFPFQNPFLQTLCLWEQITVDNGELSRRYIIYICLNLLLYSQILYFIVWLLFLAKRALCSCLGYSSKIKNKIN